MSLPQFIHDTAKIPPKEEQEISTLFQRNVLPKGHFLIQEGTRCRTLFFIEKGLVRIFRNTTDGTEVTAFFMPENTFVTALDSFYKDTPTRYNFVLLEDSVIYSIKRSDLDLLLNTSHAFTKFIFKTMYELSAKLTELLSNVKFRTAEERY